MGRTSPTSAVSYLSGAVDTFKVDTTFRGFSFAEVGATGASGGEWPGPVSAGQCTDCELPLLASLA